MRWNKHAFILAALGAYSLVFAPIYAHFSDSIQIGAILLVGWFGWLYGIRVGLLSIILLFSLNALLLYGVADNRMEVLYTYYPTGSVMAFALTLVAGYLHDSRIKLEQQRLTLEDRVNEATRELEEKTRQLILKDEMERIRIGQDLHDGVGQYLTGMLLHCESLAEKLDTTGLPQAALAHRMTERIGSSLQVVRRLSRSHLPIQPNKVRLEATFEEMAGYFQEIADVRISVNCSGSSAELPTETVQHLHRIAQETMHCAIYECKATELEIEFHAEENSWMLRVSAMNARFSERSPSCMESHTMKYRAKSIGAELTGKMMPNSGFEIMCGSRGNP